MKTDEERKTNQKDAKKSVAVFGVVFPQMKNFLDDYLSSLQKQTYKNFDLIIINDGFRGFEKIAKKYNLNIKEIKYSGGIAKNRETGINYTKDNGYDYLIFTDSDDFFASNRVEKSVDFLKFYDIVVNDFTLVSEEGKVLDSHYFSNRLKNLSKIDLDFIKDKNIFGLSNTALRVNCLKGKIKFNNDLIAPDWNLYSSLLKEGCTAVFTNETATFYRIYKGNIIGLSSLNEEKIKKGIEVKYQHYKALSGQNKDYKNLAKNFGELRRIIKNEDYKNNYINKVKSLHANKPFWWEEIKIF